jgi:hypothetical protein
VLSQAFHSSLFILTKKLRSSPLAALLSKIISLLQLLSFLFAKVSLTQRHTLRVTCSKSQSKKCMPSCHSPPREWVIPPCRI